MDRETAKELIKDYLPDYLRDKGINPGRPFNCLNPDHLDRHPSMSYDKAHRQCHCFSCGAKYDTFDLIGLDYGLTDNKDIFCKAYEMYGLTIDSPQPTDQEATDQKPRKQQEAPQTKDFTGYFKKVKEALKDPAAQDYLRQRGINEEVATKYWLGYDSAYKTFNVDEGGQTSFAEWHALIIPTGKGSYIARNIDKPQAPEKKNRYRKPKDCPSVVFNNNALYVASKPIFVVEGELDALSIIEAGGEAVGLGSAEGYSELVKKLEEKRPVQPLILALDADEPGEKAEEKLAEKLIELNISFYRYKPYGAAKDANEALLLDREGFIKEIQEAEKIPQNAEEVEKEKYIKANAANEVQGFLDDIRASADTPALSTGFSNLDGVLDGGLYKGLYIIGAISSLGKTTLALQIVDQLAQQGQDCLIFSLEMAQHELIAKSISRHTFLLADRKEDAKTTRGILAGARWQNYSETERGLIDKAIRQYKDYAQHIYIHEGIGDIGVEEVKDIVRQHIAITGNKPVVLIDYLQILAPYDMRASDKQNVDKATLELKRLSRDIPVIGISSFNRDNYMAPVNNASFKESGAIEYSSDVLIGLQYEGMDFQEGEAEKTRQTRIRELIRTNEKKAKCGDAQLIQAKILKNRNGSKGQVILNFYAMFNCFTEKINYVKLGKTDPFAGLRNKPAK